jgi:hypothetical protein
MEDALLSWLALVLDRDSVQLEEVLFWMLVFFLRFLMSRQKKVVGKELLCFDALRLIGPAYAPDKSLSSGAAFDEAIRRFDQAELRFPPDSPLLSVDWERLGFDGPLSVVARHEAIKVLGRNIGRFLFL